MPKDRRIVENVAVAKATTIVRLFRLKNEEQIRPEGTSMRLRPLIAPPIALSLLPILTGCHLSRAPSPALSIAAVALSAGGLLGTRLLISFGARYGRSIGTPATR